MNRMRYPEEKLTLRFTLAFLLGFFAALLVSWCGKIWREDGFSVPFWGNG